MNLQGLGCIQIQVIHMPKWHILRACSVGKAVLLFKQLSMSKFHVYSSFLISLFIQLISTSQGERYIERDRENNFPIVIHFVGESHHCQTLNLSWDWKIKLIIRPGNEVWMETSKQELGSKFTILSKEFEVSLPLHGQGLTQQIN